MEFSIRSLYQFVDGPTAGVNQPKMMHVYMEFQNSLQHVVCMASGPAKLPVGTVLPSNHPHLLQLSS